MDRRSVLKNIGLLLAAGAVAPYIPIENLMKLRLPQVASFPDIYSLLVNDLSNCISMGIDDSIINQRPHKGRNGFVSLRLSSELITNFNKEEIITGINIRQQIGKVQKLVFDENKLIAAVKFR